ncbi:MAG TPA: DDE-type integrase/transposase/recombinase [Anaerolineae bacterium]|nr:DDE-type integrase/transposase/recombinase [Anaerolineae bacterium]
MYTYAPDANYNGSDSFTVTVVDEHNAETTKIVNITVGPVNDPPVAIDDSASVTEDSDVVIYVLNNDTDIDLSREGDDLTVSAYSGVDNGTLTIAINGKSVNFEPDADWFGTEVFTYTVKDSNNATDQGEVTVTVTAINDGPVISDVTNKTVAEDGSTGAISFTVTDVDDEDGSLAVSATTSNGVVIPQANIVFGGSRSERTVTIDPAADTFKHPTKRVNELWQTDFIYFKIIGWSWYYLSTILDDYSRYILAYRLTPSMSAADVQETLQIALDKTGLDRVLVKYRPCLLSDNGSCYLSRDLKAFLESKHMEHTRDAPYHHMTQGKIERYHRSMKKIVKLQNYYSPWELDREIARFVEYYNHHRYHESLDNLTPANVFFGRQKGGVEQARRDQDMDSGSKTSAKLAGPSECIISTNYWKSVSYQTDLFVPNVLTTYICRSDSFVDKRK